jgi:DNA repair protein RadC
MRPILEILAVILRRSKRRSGVLALARRSLSDYDDLRELVQR